MTGTVRKRAGALLRRFGSDISGVSLMEFALALPMVVTLGFYGIEIAYMATINMQASQMALSLADNAARLGQTDNSAVTPTVPESDVSSILSGALKQGENMGFKAKGRIVLTSLELDPVTGRQFIHWQRCVGDLTTKKSIYGDENALDGRTGARITGVGAQRAIRAPAGQAVMVAEVYYRYDGLFGSLFITPNMFRQEATYLVRDNRDLQLSPFQEQGTTGARIASIQC